MTPSAVPGVSINSGCWARAAQHLAVSCPDAWRNPAQFSDGSRVAVAMVVIHGSFSTSTFCTIPSTRYTIINRSSKGDLSDFETDNNLTRPSLGRFLDVRHERRALIKGSVCIPGRGKCELCEDNSDPKRRISCLQKLPGKNFEVEY